MLRRFLTLPPAIVLAACASRAPDVLPPAPKASAMAFAERIELVLEAGDEVVVVADTAAPRVIDAGSMETVRLPREDLTVELPRDEGSNLVARFDASVLEPQVDPAERVRALADSARAARTPWVALAAVRDSMLFHKPWRRLVQRMLPEAELPIRSLVWPTPVRVAERKRSRIVLVTDWVEFRRLSADEMRCTEADDAETALPAVRLTADLAPIEGGSARIVVRFETRALSGCVISPLGTDRLAAFRFDVWNAAGRASAIGVPGTSIARE